MEDLERALTLLPDEPSAERARLLSWIARTTSLRGHYREAIVEGERARAVAEAVQLPVVVGEVLNTLGMAGSRSARSRPARRCCARRSGSRASRTTSTTSAPPTATSRTS